MSESSSAHKLLDYVYHKLISKKAKWLAGEAAILYNVIHGCEIKNTAPVLSFVSKQFFVMDHKSDLVFDMLSSLQLSLLLKEEWSAKV